VLFFDVSHTPPSASSTPQNQGLPRTTFRVSAKETPVAINLVTVRNRAQHQTGKLGEPSTNTRQPLRST
jgi:hypothetical protein